MAVKSELANSKNVPNVSATHTNSGGLSTFDSLNVTGLEKGFPKSLDTIEVEVGVDSLVGDYAKAFLEEAYRVNPGLTERLDLTKEEISRYCDFLLVERVKSCKGECPEFRKLKPLWIPVFIQYVISMVGVVDIMDEGLRLVPVTTIEPISLDEAYSTSEKLGSLARDLQMVRDAMPRDDRGNLDVMSSALVAGTVRSIHPVGHVAATYVAAFVGSKLRDEVAFQVLYRIQYDDVDFIARALTSDKTWLGVIS